MNDDTWYQMDRRDSPLTKALMLPDAYQTYLARMNTSQLLRLYHDLQRTGVDIRSFLIARRKKPDGDEVVRMAVNVPERVQDVWRQRGWEITPVEWDRPMGVIFQQAA